MKIRILCIMIWLFYYALCNAQPSSNYQNALLKIYPNAMDTYWHESDNYNVATFMYDGFETKAWMNSNAQWIMSTTDIKTLDQLPANIYNVFMFSQYSQWDVTNVYKATFPIKEKVFIIKANEDNSIATYLLFFAPSGKELQSIDVTYTDYELTPTLFGIE